MSTVVADRVVDTTTTAGTGAITVAGVGITGYRGITTGYGLGSGQTFYYLIEAVDANGASTGDWEVGLGTVTATGPVVFSRTEVFSSSNSNSLVSFAAGTKRVHLIAPAATTQFAGGAFRKTANLSAQNLTTLSAVTWDYPLYDTPPVNFLHDNTTNPSRITLPDDFGDTFVRLFGQVALTGVTTNDIVTLEIRSGGTSVIAGAMHQTSSTSPYYQVTSPIIQASPTDYWELMIQTGTSTSVTILGIGSSFQIEILQ